MTRSPVQLAARIIVIDGDAGIATAAKQIGVDNAMRMQEVYALNSGALMVLAKGYPPAEEAVDELVRLYEAEPAD